MKKFNDNQETRKKKWTKEEVNYFQQFLNKNDSEKLLYFIPIFYHNKLYFYFNIYLFYKYRMLL